MYPSLIHYGGIIQGYAVASRRDIAKSPFFSHVCVCTMWYCLCVIVIEADTDRQTERTRRQVNFLFNVQFAPRICKIDCCTRVSHKTLNLSTKNQLLFFLWLYLWLAGHPVILEYLTQVRKTKRTKIFRFATILRINTPPPDIISESILICHYMSLSRNYAWCERVCIVQFPVWVYHCEPAHLSFPVLLSCKYD